MQMLVEFLLEKLQFDLLKNSRLKGIVNHKQLQSLETSDIEVLDARLRLNKFLAESPVGTVIPLFETLAHRTESATREDYQFEINKNSKLERGFRKIWTIKFLMQEF